MNELGHMSNLSTSLEPSRKSVRQKSKQKNRSEFYGTSNAQAIEAAADRRLPPGWLPRTPHAVTFKEIDGARELELILKYQSGDQAAGGILVQAHEKLIWKFASGSLRRVSEATCDDVMQAARLGFLHAIRKFDPALGFKLSTYSKAWIQHYSRRYLDETSTTIGIPANVLDMRRKAKRMGVKLSELPGAPANAVETESYDFDALSLDIVVGDGGQTHVDLLGDPTASPERDVETAEQQAIFERMIAESMVVLTPREAYVVRMTELSDSPETLKELGDRFGLCRERVRQIQAKALKKMKVRLVRIKERTPKWRPILLTPPAPVPPPAADLFLTSKQKIEATQRRGHGRPGPANTSGFIGVSFIERAGKWRASVHWGKETSARGLWPTAEIAAHEYDKAALMLKGPNAPLNFPEDRERLLAEMSAPPAPPAPPTPQHVVPSEAPPQLRLDQMSRPLKPPRRIAAIYDK